MVKKVLSVKNLVKTYNSGKVKTFAVRGVSFDLFAGDFVALTGPSGSGKSTILYQLGLLDTPTKGIVIIDGKNLSQLESKEKSDFRLNKIGYVFQRHELLPELTALENVYLPLISRLDNNKDYLNQSKEVLEILGLGERLNHYPNELSGGEMQRVSIARALVVNPEIILADEPTANLDSVVSKKIIKMLKLLNKKMKYSIFILAILFSANCASEVITCGDALSVKGEAKKVIHHAAQTRAQKAIEEFTGKKLKYPYIALIGGRSTAENMASVIEIYWCETTKTPLHSAYYRFYSSSKSYFNEK